MFIVRSFWNWISEKPELPALPTNLICGSEVSAKNDFWISCILDPTLEIKYVNGVVTKLQDTEKCLINGIYHYQPRTEKEICNFPYIVLNSPVRICLYRKKNSEDQWKVASCLLNSDSHCHQENLIRQNESIQVHLTSDEPTVQINEKIETNENDENNHMTFEVLGDIFKVVNFQGQSTVQILFKNNSYVKEQVLLDYQTMELYRSQLCIVNKIQLPLIFSIQSQHIIDINIKGKYIGKSTEYVRFNFKDTIYKVGINFDVTDSRIIIPLNTGSYSNAQVNMRKLYKFQDDNIIPGVRTHKRVQFKTVHLRPHNIPNGLFKCYQNKDGFRRAWSEVKENISNLYPAAFETLTYQNYVQKFHILLFIEEMNIIVAFQKYASDRIQFKTEGEYLVLKISDLAESRPSLIPGDKVIVTDPPNCTRLGQSQGYEGIIHKVLADEIKLKFDPEFHNICGHWEYSVHFMHLRTHFRKQHQIIDECWKKTQLGESFLFPHRDSLNYQPPKLEILSFHEKNSDIYSSNNLNDDKTMLPKPKVVQKIRWFNENLNKEQKSAVINILKAEARPIPYIIYGPPGTGKTITLTESIIQVYNEFPKSKLLICAPTNNAIDILLDKLINSRLFGKTVMRRLISYTYHSSPSFNMDYDEYISIPRLENVKAAVQDPKSISKRDILKLRIVMVTTGTAGSMYMMGLKCGTFSHIFIDEAGQSTEPEILLPLSFLDPHRGGQCVLAGDPKQLGPFLLAKFKKTNGLEQSMLGRFINQPSYQRDLVIFPEYNGYNPKVITHLIQNYRSLPEIVHLYSSLFYESLLVPTLIDDNTRENMVLKNLNANTHWDNGCKGSVIVHGIEGKDLQGPTSPSWFNPHEAFQVMSYFEMLTAAGISADDIGVITPYISQVYKINELLKLHHPDVKLPKVGTVEFFQGQEKMVIIISIVRSKSSLGGEQDKKFNLGFLTASERTNVALSRARALVIVIGDPLTMLTNDNWTKVLFHAVFKDNYIGCNFSPPYQERDS